MKKRLFIVFVSLLLCVPATARDTVLKLPLADVFQLEDAAKKLDGTVKFYLKGQPTPTVISKYSEEVANRKTNGFGKSDAFGCKWAALSALIALQDTAKKSGGNAVIDIVSYYRKNTFESPTVFECHAGAAVIGVTLKGTIARIVE